MHRLVSTLVLVPALSLLVAACCGGYPNGVCPRPEVTFPETTLRPRLLTGGGGPARDVIIESCKAPADCKKAGVPPKCALGVTCDTSQTGPDGSAGVCVFQLDPTCKCYDGDIRYCNTNGVGSCTPPGPAGCGISTCSTSTVATGQWGSCEALPQPQGPCGAPGQPCCSSSSSCSPGATCAGSSCVACGAVGQPCCAGACASGACDGGSCVQCGALGQRCCGNACSVGDCDASGRCICNLTTCGATCTNLQTDPSNCGSCGRNCSGGGSSILRYCVSGKCSPCPAGHMDCLR